MRYKKPKTSFFDQQTTQKERNGLDQREECGLYHSQTLLYSLLSSYAIQLIDNVGTLGMEKVLPPLRIHTLDYSSSHSFFLHFHFLHLLPLLLFAQLHSHLLFHRMIRKKKRKKKKSVNVTMEWELEFFLRECLR